MYRFSILFRNSEDTIPSFEKLVIPLLQYCLSFSKARCYQQRFASPTWLLFFHYNSRTTNKRATHRLILDPHSPDAHSTHVSNRETEREREREKKKEKHHAEHAQRKKRGPQFVTLAQRRNFNHAPRAIVSLPLS